MLTLLLRLLLALFETRPPGIQSGQRSPNARRILEQLNQRLYLIPLRYPPLPRNSLDAALAFSSRPAKRSFTAAIQNSTNGQAFDARLPGGRR